MTETASPYAALENRFARIARIDDALGILHWDYETTMPEGAAPTRAETLATLDVLRHDLLVDPQVADWLDAADAGADVGLDEWQRANLREMRRAWRHAIAVPGDLVEASRRAEATCEMAWRRARAEDDFAGLLPSLSEVLNLQRQVAEAKAAAFGCDKYDALLDAYEPGGRAARIDALFADLADFLPGFTDEVLEAQARAPDPVRPIGHFPIDRQRGLGRELMQAIGFDFDHGRLDVSAHPFCGGGLSDVRITTRYDEGDFTRSLMGVMHETGHALYEQGRPAGWLAQPVGQARGMAAHESQSLLVEMQTARSRPFLEYLAPLVRDTFGGDGPAWTADNLYRLYTRVERSLIRVDADEVTYPAHIILRFRLERAMIGGDLKLADLPGAWAEGMRALVGVFAVRTTAPGCLREHSHWSVRRLGVISPLSLGARWPRRDCSRRARQTGRKIEAGIRPWQSSVPFGSSTFCIAAMCTATGSAGKRRRAAGGGDRPAAFNTTPVRFQAP